jgi:signal transduction histidine kinase/ActR/RegA family two-component response regulator
MTSQKSLTEKSERLLLISAAVLAILLEIVFTQLLISQSSKSNFKERLNTENMLMSKNIQAASASFNMEWNRIDYVTFCAAEEKFTSAKDVSEFLIRFKDSVRDDTRDFYLVMADDQYYGTDGKSGWWTPDELLPERESEQILIKSIPGQSSESVVMIKRIDNPIPVGDDGTEISYVIIAQNDGSFQKTFTENNFDNVADLYVVSSDGSKIFSGTNNQQNVFGGYNINSSLATLQYQYGASAENILSDLAAGKSGSVGYMEQGVSYILTYAPIPEYDWYLLTSIREDAISVNSQDSSNLSLFYIGCMFAVAAVLISLFAIIMGRQGVRQQKAIAIAATEANRSKSEFLSRMSHDIRTPLNGIIGMTSIAREDPGNREKVEGCLKEISTSSDHLMSLINDVLDMSRIESNRIILANEPMNILSLTAECDSILKGYVGSRSIKIDTDKKDINHPFVFGDEVRIKQILLNVLSNAVKYTPDGGKITVVTEESEGNDASHIRCRFIIADTGIGMSEGYQKYLFEAFAQEDSSNARTQYKGSGLGLAIVKQLTDLMGGTVNIRSRTGAGTTVTIEIPFEIDPNRSASAETVSDAGNESAANADCLKGIRILLAEDVEVNRVIAVHILKKMGAEVTEAVNGRMAVEAFRRSERGTYQCILMDIMMPEMNGYEATEAIRFMEREDAKTIPIIAMTANAFTEDVQKAREHGMNDHIAKPIDVEKLQKTLVKWCKEGGNS